MTTTATARPVLAGLCSRIGDRLGWNPWGLRAAFLVLLAVKPLIAIGGYLGGVLLMEWFGPKAARRCRRHRTDGGAEAGTTFVSPELAERAARIEALKRRIDRL